MQEVVVGHYRAFITAADALHSVSQEMTSVDEHLESLVGMFVNSMHTYANYIKAGFCSIEDTQMVDLFTICLHGVK